MQKELCHVVVLKGGNSSEREISLKSAQSVIEALRSKGYHVIDQDLKEPMITEEMKNADVVFPILHGGFGEDGTIQKLMEDANISFVGSGSQSCLINMDKILSKRAMDEAGIPNAKWTILKPHQSIDLPEFLKIPVVVKAPRQGSTVGIALVFDEKEYAPAVEMAFRYGDEVLIEEYMAGREITVGIVDGVVLPLVEIRTPGKFYDWDAKYTYKNGQTEYFCPPPTLSDELQLKIQENALKYYQITKARDLLRVDFLVNDDGRFIILEGNSIPGFTSASLLPKAAAKQGWSFPELCSKLVNLAASRR